MKLRQLKRLAEQAIDEYLPEFDNNECRIETTWQAIPSAEEIISSEQHRAQIHTAINQLPDAYRIILLLRDIEGYDTSEVAQLLDIAESNVKVRLHRARAALKKLIEPSLRNEVLT
jgi:RNA polymerase sigma-70 factor (ECF subfamily)